MTAGLTDVAGLFDVAAPDLDTHLRLSGPMPWRRKAGALIADIEAAGLTGRGGAGFPTWRKLKTVAEGRSPIVIGNGAEGEPASAKDHTLLVRAPHLVLDGLQLAAETVRAAEAYLYVPAGPAADAVGAALAERTAQRWDALPVTVVPAPRGFLSGQESAVVSAIEGGPARPVDRLELTVRSGVRGHPTLVQNVETLAHVAQIARYGAEWFRQCDTFLATVSGAVRAPGVHEVPVGIPLTELLAKAGLSGELRAALVGGYHGTWVSASDVAIPLSGKVIGAGVVVALDARHCGLEAAAEIVRYLARQSARQCGPCLNGLPALAQAMSALAAGGNPELPAELANLVGGRGACHHPDGVARFVRSALAAFEDDIAHHLRGDCTATMP